MPFAFAPPDQPSIPIQGSDERFPIRRIYCVGRNYDAHAREMGADPTRELPFYFSKFADAYVENGATIAYPAQTVDYQHELELVVMIGKAGFRIARTEAFAHIFGYATGLDMTRRDLQLAARQGGRPWHTGKNFSRSAPMTAIVPAGITGPLVEGAITLDVNDKRRQSADLADLIWSVDEIIADLSRYDELLPGDVIMTGTPAGVAAVREGDRLVGRIAGLPDLSVTIGASA